MGDRATVVGVCAAIGEQAQAASVPWEAEKTSGLGSGAAGKEDCSRRRPLLEPGARPGKAARQTVGEGQSLLGDVYGRLEELGPRAAAEAPMQRPVQVRRPWHGDRLQAAEGHGVEAPRSIAVASRRPGGRPAPIEGEDAPGTGLVDDGEGVAAEAAVGEQRDPFHRRRGDSGVEGVAA